METLSMQSGRRCGRFTIFGLMAWLLCLGLLWPTLASAQVSAFCPTPLTVTVANGGTGGVNVSACDGPFDGGMSDGPPATPPVHGTYIIGTNSGGVQFVTYSHNGNSATSDTFTLLDNDNSLVRINITISPPASPITVSPASLSTLTAGTPFSQTLTSSGGLAPYTYTLQSGALPVGLSLSSAGVLSGTPTQRGGYAFTVRSTDATTPTAQFVDKGYTGTVQNPNLALSPNTFSAIQGVPTSFSLATVGGVAPHTYQTEPVPGVAPAPGLTMTAAGVISGTPTTIGSTTTTLRVTDASTPSAAPYSELEPLTINVVAPPSVSIAVAPASVSEDGATNLVYTVTRSANLAAATLVNITTSGTATSGVDYGGGVATVNIPSGATTATITINPAVDGLVEADETVTLTVAAGTGYTVGTPSSATGTILNDDVPTATITVSPATVAEDGAPNLVYTVNLNQASLTALSINYTVGGTAINGTDYATITSPLVIPAGNVTGTVTADPTADAAVEADETVLITLAAGTGYTVGVPNSATGTILNDDLPTLTINDVSLTEGNAGTTNATFTVSLSAPAGPGGVTFDIATANGTATATRDYLARSFTGQTIPAGSSTYTISIPVIGDLLNELNETYFVNVTNVTNAIVGDGQGLGTIIDDDALPSISINDVTVVEGNAGTVNAVFTATLSAASGQIVGVNYATADGTATQPADYTSTTGALTFTPGQTTRTITVPVIGETVPEANETFFVNLSGATNATIADNQGLGTITNDDVPVTVNPATLPDGAVAVAYAQTVTASGGVGPYTFTVTAGSLPAGVTLSSGGALSGTPTAGGSFNFTVTATDSSPFPGPFAGSRAYTVVIAAPTIVLPATPLAGGTLGAAYSAAITPASGGTSPYAYAITAGALPAGLNLNAATGAITGTPGAVGTFNFDITATDSSTGTGPYTATQSYSIDVIDVPPVANPVSITVAYNSGATPVPLNITGGAPTSVAIGTPSSNGTEIPSGITITYQPNPDFSGTDTFTYLATNSGGTSAPATVTVTVSDPVITITPSGGFAATVGTPYTQTFTWNGGAQPYSGYQVTNLPAGLTTGGFTANSVTVSGTPTQAGSFSLNASATDSSTGNGPFTVGQAFTLTVAGPTLALAPASTTFNAPYGVAGYSQSFTASGGIGAYTYALSGALPPGVTFAGNTVSGTPTAPGSYSFTITATDTGSTGTGSPFTVAQNYIINVAAPTIVVNPATLPNPTAGNAYSQTLTASGGVGPYGFTLGAGSLPSGITLANSGALSGTSNEVGTFNIAVTATDANGQTGSRAYTLTIAAPTLTLAPAAGVQTLTYGAPYTQAFTAGGSAGPFNYVLSGALPTGVTFSGNTLSGTPTAPGSYPVTVTATDTVLTGAGAPFSITQDYVLNVPAPTITVNPATLPNPTAGTAYSQTVTVTGGVAPYSTAVTSGTLPTGITLSSGGALSGTSFEVGTYNITVTGTDANGQTGSRAYTLTIVAPTLSMSPAAGVQTLTYGAPYTQAFTASGSPGPYSYVLSGALPAGVTFSGNTLSGTPTVPGSYPVTITATDTVLTGAGAPFSIAQNYTLDVPAPVITMTPATLPNTTAGLAYSQTITASGGIAPYSFMVTAGALPNGLTLASGGALSGTTTTSGTFNFTVTAADANGQNTSTAYTVVVAVPTLTLTPATLPAGTAGTAYTQALTIAGGIAPYTVILTGTLPTGLTFNAATRTFSGTPTQAGTFNLSVTVTDSTGGTAATVTNAYTLTIATPTLTLTPATVPAGTAGVAYSQTFVASGGIAPYAYSLSAGALPAGLTLNAAGALSGTPTVVGTFNFSVTATDSTTGTAATATIAYTLTLSAPVITITPATLPNSVQQLPYTQALTATGGTAPYTFAVTAGALPAGLTLSTAGALSGTPTVSGLFNFTIRATDALGFTGTRVYALTVVDRPDPSKDPEVRGLLEAQADATRRFATTQINNFQQRLERLHGAGQDGGFDNGLSVSYDQYCPEMVGAIPGRRCDRPTTGSTIGAAMAEQNNARASDGNNAYGIWTAGTIRSGNHDGRNGSADVDFETDGLSAGLDYRVNDALTIGGGVGYGTDSSDIGENGSRSKGSAYSLAVYGSYSPGEVFFMDGLWGYQSLDYDLRRFVTTNGNFVDGKRKGTQWFGSVSAGADIQKGAWQFTPYVRADIARADLDAYTEHGDAIFALTYNHLEVDTDTGNVGVRIDYRREASWGLWSPQLRLEYQHDFKGNGAQTMRYADLPTGPFYRADLNDFDRSRLMLGLGVLFNLSNDWSFKFDYRGLIGSGGDSDHGVQLNVDKKF